MIEAVNAVVANASLLRGNAEVASAARSFAANPERVQEIAQAPYVSPYIHVDVNYNKAVLQIRDGETGDVLKQFPSESALQYQSRQTARQASAKPSAPAFKVPEHVVHAQTQAPAPTPAPQPQAAPAPQANAQAQVAAAALASTAAQAQAVSAPPTSGNVVVTA